MVNDVIFNTQKNTNDFVEQIKSYSNYIRTNCSIRKIRLSATTIYLMCGTEKGKNLFLISNPYSASSFADILYSSIYNKKQTINDITILDKNWMMPLEGISTEKLKHTISIMNNQLKKACCKEKLRSIFMIGFGYDIIDNKIFITPHFHGITFKNKGISKEFRESFAGGFFNASSVHIREITATEKYTKEQKLLGWIQYMCFQFPIKYSQREKDRKVSYPLKQDKNFVKVMQLLGSIPFTKITVAIGRQEKQILHELNLFLQDGINAGQEFIQKYKLRAIKM